MAQFPILYPDAPMLRMALRGAAAAAGPGTQNGGGVPLRVDHPLDDAVERPAVIGQFEAEAETPQQPFAALGFKLLQMLRHRGPGQAQPHRRPITEPSSTTAWKAPICA